MTPDRIILWCKAFGAILSLVAGVVMLVGLKVIEAQRNELESVKKTCYDEIRKMVTEMIAKVESEIDALIAEAKEKKAAEKADEKAPSFLDTLIKEMELRGFEPVMMGKIIINSKKEK